MESFGRKLSHYLQAAVLAFPVLFTILITSCVTESQYAGSRAEAEGPVTVSGTSYYLAKGNISSNINNIMFAWYAEHISAVLSGRGMVPAPYEKTDVVIMVEYGKKEYPESSLAFRREYDRSANTTRWVHEESDPVEMAYIRLTAVEGDLYRGDGSKKRLWHVEIYREAEERPFEESFPALLRSLWAYFHTQNS